MALDTLIGKGLTPSPYQELQDIINELLCTVELNQDSLEEDTKQTIEKAYLLLNDYYSV